MQKFKSYKYKDINIDCFVYENGMFSAKALDILSTKNTNEKTRDIKYNHISLKDVETDIQIKIDNFLSHTPETYKELSFAITNTLVWDGNEDCHADEFIIKTLIENFLKVRE